jgi:hypothetical protein
MFSAKNIKVDSPIFHWIRCVSMAVIAAVIARIVFFPVGILTESTMLVRIVCTLIILAVSSSTICFVILNHVL